jgi:hypothetical protein
MALALDEPGARIGAGAYESELARCPVAAAVDYSKRNDIVPPHCDPAWGTRAEFRDRVVAFVAAFHELAEEIDLGLAVDLVRAGLERRRLTEAEMTAVVVRAPRLSASAPRWSPPANRLADPSGTLQTDERYRRDNRPTGGPKDRSGRPRD